MILLIDNYDSFSYNLFQLVGALAQDLARPAGGTQDDAGGTARHACDAGTGRSDAPSAAVETAPMEVRVVRNDALTVDEVRALAPTGIILSPGPGRPEDAGICVDVVRQLGARIPILGVCLGHQAICLAYGASVGYARHLMHGKQSVAAVVPQFAGNGLFADLPDALPVARYHSLAVDAATLPPCLHATSRADDGEVMSVRHAEHPVFGLQFHPESILTPEGPAMMRNFLLAKERFWQTGTTR
jgi:anthranilate synthase component 2